jgi:phage shock protein C
MSVNDRLYRSIDDRVLAGVCAGLADRLDLDPALVRIGYAILALLSGIVPLLVLYVIMVVVIPEGPSWTGVRSVGPQPTGPGWTVAGTPATGTSSNAGTPADAAAPAAGMAGDAAAPTDAAPTDAAPTQAMPTAAGPVPGWIPPGLPGGWDAASWRGQRNADRAARHAERAARRGERHRDPIAAIIAGLFLVGLGAFFLLRRTFDIDWAIVWPVAVIALGAVVLIAAVRPRSG